MRIIAVLLFFATLSACESGEQHPPAKYEEKKASMQETESTSPLKFLRITGSNHGNLLNQTVVEGQVTNKATLVTYKSIQVRITFLDKDGAVIDKEKDVLDDEVKPGATIDFKIKTGHVKGVNSVTLAVLGAVAEQ